LSELPKRNHQRIALNLRAHVSLPGITLDTARVVDLSLGGVGVLTERSLPIGSRCNVIFRLTMPNGKLFTVTAVGKTMQSTFSGSQSGFKTGVSFVEVPEMALAAIGQYIQDKNKPNR
jgi:c-di-GMP-binding flagellar brake protein YcgR